jgi:sialic acid synthase
LNWSTVVVMDQILSKGEEPFFIAEVGQNHNGILKDAQNFIRIFASEGADAIKFQTRNNKYLFSTSAYNMKYNSENAFGSTYGEHREFLEIDPDWIPILKRDCQEHNVFFMSTPFDEPSLDLLLENDVDILKLASFDLGNLPFVDCLAKSGKPVVMSTGGGNMPQIRSTVRALRNYGSEVAVLHCVSEYPCEFDRLGLQSIETLKSEFPECLIGSSDHFNGTLSGPIAYLLGARIFEKHVTLNRASKGTDHSFALEREGFRKFVRDTKRVRHMLPPKPVSQLGAEPVFKKLGKSLVSKKDIHKGEKIVMASLSGKIFEEQYLPVRESELIIGSTAKRRIEAGQPITLTDVELDQ